MKNTRSKAFQGKVNEPHGHTVIFDKIVEIGWQKPGQNNTDKVAVRFTMTKKRLLDKMEELQFTITQDTDIFYLIESKLSYEEFEELKKQNNLSCHFEQIGYEIAKMLQGKAEHPISIIFNENENKEGELSFVEMTELLKLNLLSLHFKRASIQNAFAHAKTRMYLIQKQLDHKNRELNTFYKELKKEDAVFFDLNFKKKAIAFKKTLKKGA